MHCVDTYRLDLNLSILNIIIFANSYCLVMGLDLSKSAYKNPESRIECF